VGIPGLILSIISTFFLLWKKTVSNTAWIYATLSIVAFTLAGFMGVIYIGSSITVRITLATPFGLVGGYILIFLALNQYLHDKRRGTIKSSILNNGELQ